MHNDLELRDADLPARVLVEHSERLPQLVLRLRAGRERLVVAPHQLDELRELDRAVLVAVDAAQDLLQFRICRRAAQ